MDQRPEDPEIIRKNLIQLLVNFEDLLKRDDLRTKVLYLVESLKQLRALGKSIVGIETASGNGARARILAYFKVNVGQVISGEELHIVSGIQEYARRVRELRVELGWPIISGIVIKEMIQNKEIDSSTIVKPDAYLLLAQDQDRDAAYRWNLANTIRKEKKLSIRDRILKYLLENVGKQISGEELRYVADNKTEWARRVRELRTELGWPVFTKNSGREDLKIGVYILEDNRQGQTHDRKIADNIRVLVLERDRHACRKCGWTRNNIQPGDPRKLLELHHVVHHINRGDNTADNLLTLCNVCHDLIHKLDKGQNWDNAQVGAWLDETSINRPTHLDDPATSNDS
jgi:hypothetical protein